MHTRERKGLGDYNGDTNNKFGDYNTIGTGASKMKSTHKVTVKITNEVLPKEIVEFILDCRKGQI